MGIRIIARLCIGVLCIAGCSGSDPGVTGGATTAPPTNAPAASGNAAPAAAKPPSSPATNTVAGRPAGGAAGASTTVTPPPVSAAGTAAPSGAAGSLAAGSGAGGMGGSMLAGGSAAPTGGMTAGAAGVGGAMSGMLATEPVIPEIKGDCPTFMGGSATIMGASLTFLAAKKSEGNGTLVFYWHGTGSSPLEGSMFAGMQDIMKDGGLVVGFARGTGTGGDCSGTGEHAIDDFKVADQLVACAVKNFGINPKRIYATGCSAGGLQSGCMGINRSAYIAAVAPNSGGVTIGYGPFQDLTRVPNVMTMHGAPGADVVIVDFSQTSEAYDNYMVAKGAFAVNCNHGGGHCGAPGALQASAWQFMKDHPFGTHPSPYAGGLPSGFYPACKIWTPTSRQPLGEGRGMMMMTP